jgi:uncharacterized Zn finger protein
MNIQCPECLSIGDAIRKITKIKDNVMVCIAFECRNCGRTWNKEKAVEQQIFL